MAQVSWQAAADGRYLIDVVVGNYNVQAMIDLGLVDPADLVGCEIEPALYDQLEQSGWLTGNCHRQWRDASGRYSTTKSALTRFQLVDPIGRQPVGPVLRLFANRGRPGLLNRVGVVFFHCLKGCRILWDLDSRTWCVEYP